MAFGKSIMSRFSDDIEVLDPAYEGLYDSDETELDAFLKIACEGSEPWCADDECDDAIFVDEDEDDEDYDEDDDDEDEDDDDDENYKKSFKNKRGKTPPKAGQKVEMTYMSKNNDDSDSS